jgi:uncharacterized protein YcaQ
VTAPLSISARAARRFLIHAFGLPRVQALPDAQTVLDTLEFIQMDSINVCGRMHDLICGSRIAGYTTEGLYDLLYRDPRRAWEDYFPNLCVLPLRDYPYFVRGMRARAATPDRWHGLLPTRFPSLKRCWREFGTTDRCARGRPAASTGTRPAVGARAPPLPRA